MIARVFFILYLIFLRSSPAKLQRKDPRGVGVFLSLYIS